MFTNNNLYVFMFKVNLQQPVIKSFDCVDHDPIDEWIPVDPFDVDFWMNFSIGVEESKGADNFQVHVVTHETIKNTKDKKYMIVLDSYSWPKLLKQVEDILMKCEGYDWSDISEKLSKYFYWEFDNYKP